MSVLIRALLLVNRSTHHNILLHGGVTTSSGSRGCSSGRVLVGARLEVVSHVGIELLGCLLRGASVASTLLLGGAGLANGTLGVDRSLLLSSSRLGLGLGLSSALSKSLDRRDNLVRLRSANNNLNL